MLSEGPVAKLDRIVREMEQETAIEILEVASETVQVYRDR